MKKMTGRLLAALCAIVVMLSFTTVVFAEEAETSVETSADTAVDTTADTAADTAEADDDETETTGTTNAAEEAEKEAKKMLLWSGIITLAIIVVVVICVLVWALKDRERALKTWRSFKSEFKKVVWAEKHETLKNTILVIVACVVIAAVLGLVDYLFSLGVVGLGNLI